MQNQNRTVDPEFWKRAAAMRKLLSQKKCVVNSIGGCGGPVISAHTIPRSQLRKIALNGHVYALAGIEALEANNGQPTSKLFGVNDFSTLNCFCSQHDGSIFRPIETRELVFDGEQISLLHYRAIAAELYKKSVSLENVKRNLEEERKRKGQSVSIRLLEAFLKGHLLGMRDIGSALAKAEKIILESKYEQISALVLNFDLPPTIMTVGGFLPEFDYNGRTLQTLGVEGSALDYVSLSILSANDHAAVAFTWFADAKAPQRLADSLLIQRDELLTTLAIQTAFEHIENTCMEPTWWNSLKRVERHRLLERLQWNGGPAKPRERFCLEHDGMRYDQWNYVKHTYVNAGSTS